MFFFALKQQDFFTKRIIAAKVDPYKFLTVIKDFYYLLDNHYLSNTNENNINTCSSCMLKTTIY